MATGTHRLEYEVVEGWERLPEGWAFTEVAGVAVDSRDRVYVFCRGRGRGPGQFNLPHGIAVDRQGRVYVADRENSRVQVFGPDGTLRRIWDWPNRPCECTLAAACPGIP